MAVDIRRDSKTFGQWFGCELSTANGKQLFIPAGFAHGFLTLEPGTEIIYTCPDFYAPETEGALLWNDPDIGIEWPRGRLKPVPPGKGASSGNKSNFKTLFTAQA